MADDIGIEGPVARVLRRVDQDSRRYNVALWRVAKGRPGPGGVVAELAVLTGLHPEAVRARASEARRKYPAEPGCPGEHLTLDDRHYLESILHRGDSPEVLDFYGGISGGQRRRPDQEDPRVARQRVGGRLISIAIDPRRD